METRLKSVSTTKHQEYEEKLFYYFKKQKIVFVFCFSFDLKYIQVIKTAAATKNNVININGTKFTGCCILF
jgi:hypothetical protein